MRYDYREQVRNDLIDFIEEQGGEVTIYDALNSDSVTGNASGSYFCNTYKAAECLCLNWDLLEEAMDFYGYEGNPLKMGEEACDVWIRSYIVEQIFDEVYGEYMDEKE